MIFLSCDLAHHRSGIVADIQMRPQQVLEMRLEPYGKFFAKYLVIFVFSYGKNVTTINPGLGIGGDRSHDGAYRHWDIYLAEKLFFLTVMDDLVDLFQVAELQGNDRLFDLFGPEGGSFLIHDIVEGKIGQDPIHVKIYEPIYLIPWTERLFLIEVFENAKHILGPELDQCLQQFFL